MRNHITYLFAMYHRGQPLWVRAKNAGSGTESMMLALEDPIQGHPSCQPRQRLPQINLTNEMRAITKAFGNKTHVLPCPYDESFALDRLWGGIIRYVRDHVSFR